MEQLIDADEGSGGRVARARERIDKWMTDMQGMPVTNPEVEAEDMLKEGDGDKKQDEMQEVNAEATESKDSQENEETTKEQESEVMRESVTLQEAPTRRKNRQDVRIKTPEKVAGKRSDMTTTTGEDADADRGQELKRAKSRGEMEDEPTVPQTP